MGKAFCKSPAWGYWWRTYKKLSPSHLLFKTFNHLAWTSQILAGLLMLFPPTRFIGGAIIIGMFAFVGSQIRLGLLCEIVMFCSAVLFFHPGSLGDGLISMVISTRTPPEVLFGPILSAVNMVLEIALWGYLILLPLAHGGLSYNFYLRRTFPNAIQRVLERYTNFFGLIVWRVFSVDIVNFYIRIYRQSQSENGIRRLISSFGWKGRFRFDHVAESITLACIFTTLKYYPSNKPLFEERLLRYARTVPCPKDSILIFEYIAITKTEGRFEFVPVAEFIVDFKAGTIVEKILNDSISVRAPHQVSPVHEGVKPGSYVPLKA